MDGALKKPSVATVDTPEFRDAFARAINEEAAMYEGHPVSGEARAAFIAHIDAHVAVQVAAKDAEIKTLTAALDAQGELTDRYQEIALSAQAAAPVAAKQDNPHFATFPDQIFLQVGDCAEEETSPFDEAYRASDMTWCAESIDRYDVRYIRADLAASQQSPAPVAMTDEQISKAARHYSNKTAEACGVDPDDQWMVYGGQYIDDFREAILAAQQEAV